MANRFLIPQDGSIQPMEQQDAASIKTLMGTENVMFIHLKNDTMLGVNYNGSLTCDETTRNAVATEIYRQHVKDGIVYGTCVLVPKSDFPEPA